jgi:transposase
MFMAGSKQKTYSLEFKDEAVKLVINTGLPVAVLGRELGTVEQTLAN